MENKKFSELKVGDMLHIYYKDFISKKITKIDRDERGMIIYTQFDSYTLVDIEKEKEFHICDYKVGYFIVEAIATSMDRLLLETTY